MLLVDSYAQSQRLAVNPTSTIRFSHGVSGAVVDKGSVKRFLPYQAKSLRHGFQDIGVSSIEQLHDFLFSRKIRFEVRSSAAQREGAIHDLHSYSK